MSEKAPNCEAKIKMVKKKMKDIKHLDQLSNP